MPRPGDGAVAPNWRACVLLVAEEDATRLVQGGGKVPLPAPIGPPPAEAWSGTVLRLPMAKVASWKSPRGVARLLASLETSGLERTPGPFRL